MNKKENIYTESLGELILKHQKYRLFELSPLAGDFLTLFIQIIENNQIVFFSNLFVPWQETFADAGDGDWGGEDH